MNFSFYIYGTPNGYNQYPADEKNRMFQEFAEKNKTESQLTVHRDGKLTYYTFLRKLSANKASYLGISLVFNGVYCKNSRKIFDVFAKVFFDISLKGEILKFNKNGTNAFAVDKFVNKQVEIERIIELFSYEFNNALRHDFASLEPSFKVGNGAKNISINEQNSVIDTAIREFDYIHISDSEKSVSQLERTQKILADVYAEKSELQNNYKKLVAQKKQYKVVLFLCLILIGCAVGLFIFNKNLQSKDSQIQHLNMEISKKNQNIENLNTNIARLQSDKQQLNSRIGILKNDLRQKEENISSKDSEIENLNNSIEDLNNRISSLRSENSSKSTYYKVNVSQAYCYRLCADTYYKNDCYYSSGSAVEVYTQRDGYGLTIGGYLKMSDLTKY